MLKFTESACQVVAADSRTAIQDFDSTFASGLRLAANVVDGFRDAGIPVSQSQRVYRTINESFEHLLEGRNSMASVIAQLLSMKRNSNCAEVAAGCPIGWEDLATVFTTGSAQKGTGEEALRQPVTAV